MNLIEALRTGRNIVARRGFTVRAEPAQASVYIPPGEICRKFFIATILPHLGLDDMWDDNLWYVVLEPKRKVVRWLWAWHNKSTGNYVLASNFYDENEALMYVDAGNAIKLEWSRTEFEE